MDHMNERTTTILYVLVLLLLVAGLIGCGEATNKSRPPTNLSQTISDTERDFSPNPARTTIFQDEIMPPDQEAILLSQGNNPDADNVAFFDTTAALWKFYLER